MRFFVFATLFLFHATMVRAETRDMDFLAFSLGGNGVFNSHDDSSLTYGLEYRYRDIDYGLRPIAGILGTARGSAYGYLGLNWDLPLDTRPWVITPSFAVGAYRHGGGQDLGQALQFRSGIEVAYQFERGDRLGVQLIHLSNANLADKNPGMEALQAVYSYPLGRLF